jgi:hypothetical protein
MLTDFDGIMSALRDAEKEMRCALLRIKAEGSVKRQGAGPDVTALGSHWCHSPSLISSFSAFAQSSNC